MCLSSARVRNFPCISSWGEGRGIVGYVVAVFVIFHDANTACVGPEATLVFKDGKMSEIQEESLEFEGFLVFVMEVNGDNDVVCQPVFWIKLAPRAGSQGVAYLSLRAVSVPGFAKGFSRNGGELVQVSPTFAMNLNAGRDSYVEQSISSRCNSERRVWFCYDW